MYALSSTLGDGQRPARRRRRRLRHDGPRRVLERRRDQDVERDGSRTSTTADFHPLEELPELRDRRSCHSRRGRRSSSCKSKSKHLRDGLRSVRSGRRRRRRSFRPARAAQSDRPTAARRVPPARTTTPRATLGDDGRRGQLGERRARQAIQAARRAAAVDGTAGAGTAWREQQWRAPRCAPGGGDRLE